MGIGHARACLLGPLISCRSCIVQCSPSITVHACKAPPPYCWCLDMAAPASQFLKHIELDTANAMDTCVQTTQRPTQSSCLGQHIADPAAHLHA
eukprot:1158830-Pelagomonas_calceolata.AAC.7